MHLHLLVGGGGHLSPNARAELQKFLAGNVKNNSYTEISNEMLMSFKNPYNKKFYETLPETINPVSVQKARTGEYSYYATEKNGRLFYKKPKNSRLAAQKFKVIAKAPFKLADKISHSRFKRRLASGKYNSSPVQFKKSETVEEAVKFGKEQGLYRKIIGLKEGKADLKTLNTLNESLCNVHNRTGGRSIMPRAVIFQNAKKSADGLCAVAAYSDILDQLYILRVQELKPFTVYHEMGHANHALNTDFLKMSRITEIVARGGKNAKVTSRFTSDDELQELIFKHMGQYAMSSPAEFVADTFAHKIAGDIKIPHKLEQAYQALKGPNIVLNA